MSPDTVTETPAPDYKSTLNLPRDRLPDARGPAPARAASGSPAGSGSASTTACASTAAGRPPFVLHDGPPYANGHLHIGHALNKILKDMVVAVPADDGPRRRYVPGWDCHGLPIEWKIEEQYRAKGLDKDDVDVVDFRQECRHFAEGWVDIQREEFKRLGITGNWDRPLPDDGLPRRGGDRRRVPEVPDERQRSIRAPSP